MDISREAAKIKDAGVSRVLVAYYELELEKTKAALIQANELDRIRQLQGQAKYIQQQIKFFGGE